MRRRSAGLVVFALAVLAAAVSFFLAQELFPNYSTDHDEPVYVFQARMLADGHTTVPATQEEFFRTWLSGRHGDRLVAVFQPVWPAVLALSNALTGSMRPAAAATAAFAVALLYLLAHELTRDRRVAAAAAAVLAASPLFFLRSGTLLAYLWSFALGLAFTLLLLRAERLRRPPLFAVSGLALGVLLFTRPLDALLYSVLGGTWLLWEHRRELPVLAWRVGLLGLGAAPSVLAMLVYNRHLTGSPLQFALHAAGGNNAFGFGQRRIAAGTPGIIHGKSDALWAMADTLMSFPRWMFGGLLVLPLLWAGIRRHRRDGTLLLPWAIAVAVAFPLANVFYWGNLLIARGKDFLGPHYYLPLMAPACILIGSTVVAMFRRSRMLSAGVIAVLVVSTVWYTSDPIEMNRESRDAYAAELDALDRAGATEGIVFIPTDADGGWLLHPRPHLENRPDLSGDRLFAIDRGGRNLALASQRPDQRLWRLTQRHVADEEDGISSVPKVFELRRVAAPRIVVPFDVRNDRGESMVSVYVTDGRRMHHVVLDDASAKGDEYSGRIVLTGDGRAFVESPGGRIVTDTWNGPVSEGNLVVGAALGADLELTRNARFEQRMWFRAEGPELAVLGPGAEWVWFPAPDRTWLALPLEPVLRVGSIAALAP